jgi:hypothetical protein
MTAQPAARLLDNDRSRWIISRFRKYLMRLVRLSLLWGLNESAILGIPRSATIRHAAMRLSLAGCPDLKCAQTALIFTHYASDSSFRWGLEGVVPRCPTDFKLTA